MRQRLVLPEVFTADPGKGPLIPLDPPEVTARSPELSGLPGVQREDEGEEGELVDNALVVCRVD